MTDRRPGPPLFELLRENQPDPEHGHTPIHQQGDPEVAASTEPESVRGVERAPISAGVSRAERSAATMPDEPAPSEGGIHLSKSRVYLLIALAALVMLLVWAVAYKAGVSDGKNQMESFIPNKSLILPPSEGLTSGTPSGGTINTDPLPSEGVTEPPRAPARATQDIMTAQGYTNQDPRVSGNNYLQLATLSAEQAADAILFMNDHSMPIIGVPVVDSSVRTGNNPSRYTLYSLGLAVPGGGQFRAMQSQRNEHKRAIAALGSQWQRERRGGSDFAESKTQWVKYD